MEVDIEVNHLHQAVHAGIGAPSAQGAHGHGAELAQRAFQMILNRLTGKLALPALVPGAEVTESKSDAHEEIVAERANRAFAESKEGENENSDGAKRRHRCLGAGP